MNIQINVYVESDMITDSVIVTATVDGKAHHTAWRDTVPRSGYVEARWGRYHDVQEVVARGVKKITEAVL